MLDARENVFGLLQEDAPGVGQRDVLSATLEQGHADGFFELAYLLAQRRLRGAESRSRAREAELLGDGHEVAEMSEFHETCRLTLAPPYAGIRIRTLLPEDNTVKAPTRSCGRFSGRSRLPARLLRRPLPHTDPSTNEVLHRADQEIADSDGWLGSGHSST